MALAEQSVDPAFAPILDEIARNISRLELKRGSSEGAPATLRIGMENNVKRVVQVYWTGFEANIPDDCIGMHLEVAEPARVPLGRGIPLPTGPELGVLLPGASRRRDRTRAIRRLRHSPRGDRLLLQFRRVERVDAYRPVMEHGHL